VSVVIPAYNAERFIGIALSSLRAQSFQGWDAWIVDDGSGDRTLEIARRFAAADPRFNVLAQPNSGTPAVPRNRAITASRGPFVGFLDPDDYYMPGKLERQLAVMNGFPDVDMVFADNLLIDESGADKGERYLQRVGYLSRARPHLDAVGESVYLSRESFFAFTSAEVAGPSTSGVMVRRSALERQDRWFAEDLSIGEDLDLWFRIIERGRVAFVDEPLNAYRQHPGSLMNAGALTVRDSARAHVRNYRRARRYLGPEQRRLYRKRIAYLLFDMAYLHRLAGQGDQARTAYQRSLWWRPELRTAFAWLKTLVPPRTASAPGSRIGEPRVPRTGPRS
jgi:glycosyltransferase involved in cell wall biosynthesis